MGLTVEIIDLKLTTIIKMSQFFINELTLVDIAQVRVSHHCSIKEANRVLRILNQSAAAATRQIFPCKRLMSLSRKSTFKVACAFFYAN